MKTNNNEHTKAPRKKIETPNLDEWFANLSPEEVELAHCLWVTVLKADCEEGAALGKARKGFRARLVYLLDRLGSAPEWQGN